MNIGKFGCEKVAMNWQNVECRKSWGKKNSEKVGLSKFFIYIVKFLCKSFVFSWIQFLVVISKFWSNSEPPTNFCLIRWRETRSFTKWQKYLECVIQFLWQINIKIEVWPFSDFDWQIFKNGRISAIRQKI